MSKFMQIVIVGIIFAIDHATGVGVLGFCMGGFYLLLALYSLFTKDAIMFKRRMFVVVLFGIEIVAVAGVRDNPPDLGFLDRWVIKQAK